MITENRCEIGCRSKLALFANMKSHTGFQLVSKSVTLTDLERRKDDRRVSGIAEFAGLEFAGLENDGRTDRILTDRPRLHSMQRCKNALLTVSLFWDCCRFWSFGLSCYLAVKFSLRSFGAPLYARRPGHLSLPPPRYATVLDPPSY